jgi:hypothetical protein
MLNNKGSISPLTHVLSKKVFIDFSNKFKKILRTGKTEKVLN